MFCAITLVLLVLLITTTTTASHAIIDTNYFCRYLEEIHAAVCSQQCRSASCWEEKQLLKAQLERLQHQYNQMMKSVFIKGFYIYKKIFFLISLIDLDPMHISKSRFALQAKIVCYTCKLCIKI